SVWTQAERAKRDWQGSKVSKRVSLDTSGESEEGLAGVKAEAAGPPSPPEKVAEKVILPNNQIGNGAKPRQLQPNQIKCNILKAQAEADVLCRSASSVGRATSNGGYQIGSTPDRSKRGDTLPKSFHKKSPLGASPLSGGRGDLAATFIAVVRDVAGVLTRFYCLQYVSLLGSDQALGLFRLDVLLC
ncbi:unnamed protein product, partial [Cyprideis torosa]